MRVTKEMFMKRNCMGIIAADWFHLIKLLSIILPQIELEEIEEIKEEWSGGYTIILNTQKNIDI